MRKRRKPKVVWLPLSLDDRLGQAPSRATQAFQSSVLIGTLTANPLGAQPVVAEFPITKDFSTVGAVGTVQQGVADPSSTLADIEQSGYRLRRIVGKLVIQALQGAAQIAGDASIFIVTAGLIIRRVNADGVSLALTAPATGTFSEVNPSSLGNTMDPWIWRRSWVISDSSATSIALDPNVVAFPPSNVNYGAGVFDGPHIDAKTARIVGPEERLFLNVVCEGINGQSQGAPGAVLLLGDLRVLASMRTNLGNRRNASR